MRGRYVHSVTSEEPREGGAPVHALRLSLLHAAQRMLPPGRPPPPAEALGAEQARARPCRPRARQHRAHPAVYSYPTLPAL